MKPAKIATYTGKIIDITNLRPEDVDIIDIAHALSNLCRFGGHTREFYSVAQHSVHCSDFLSWFSTEVTLWALLHDASEAYLIDLPRPIKVILPEYKILEDNIQKVIAQRFDLPYPIPDVVKEIDNEILGKEAKRLGFLCSDWDQNCFFDKNIPSKWSFSCWTPEQSKAYFLNRFNQLILHTVKI